MQKIYNLINQTINFYNDITKQYLKTDDDKNFRIFIEEPDKIDTSFHDYADKHSELQIDYDLKTISENGEDNNDDVNNEDNNDDANNDNFKDNHELKIKSNNNVIFLKKNKIYKEIDFKK